MKVLGYVSFILNILLYIMGFFFALYLDEYSKGCFYVLVATSSIVMVKITED